MAERNNSEGFTKSRPVLDDLTNRLGKRGFSERESSGDKSLSFNYNDEDLAKRIRVSSGLCTEISSLKENVVSSISNITDGTNQAVSKSSNYIETNRDDYFLKGENAVIGNSNVRIGYRDIEILGLGLDNDALPNMKEKASENFKRPNFTDLEVGEPLDSITTEALSKKNEILEIAQSNFAHLKGNECDLLKGNVLQSVDIKGDEDLSDTFLADESKASLEGSQSDVSEYNHADNLVFSQCGSIDCTILPESQESMVFGVDKFMEMKNGNECDGGNDSIKACSCSFCTKAGYIWLDLNYQDIKARLSALRKSQKEASILAERIIRSKGIEKHGAESFNGVSKLESDLMYQWRSLFQHMGDVMEQESNQLESRLLPLNDLIDKCKTDLELIGAARCEKR